MSDDDLENKVYDTDYRNALWSMTEVHKSLMKAEQYRAAQAIYWSWKRITEDYISFRLEKYSSESNKVIRKVYNILGYNPYKSLPPHKNE